MGPAGIWATFTLGENMNAQVRSDGVIKMHN